MTQAEKSIVRPSEFLTMTDEQYEEFMLQTTEDDLADKLDSGELDTLDADLPYEPEYECLFGVKSIGEASQAVQNQLKSYRKFLKDEGAIKPCGSFKNAAERADYEEYEKSLKDDWFSVFTALTNGRTIATEPEGVPG